MLFVFVWIGARSHFGANKRQCNTGSFVVVHNSIHIGLARSASHDLLLHTMAVIWHTYKPKTV